MTDSFSQLNPRSQWFKKILNTYLPFFYLPLPWRKSGNPSYWETRIVDDSLGPRQYVDLQESSHVLIDEVMKQISGPDAAVLDLGCNVGRHLNELHKRGLTNLYGMDVQRSALELMPRQFPEMAAHAKIQQGSFEEYLPGISDRFFEVVFTHGVTVELVPPTFPICRHLARVASKSVVLVIHESTKTAFPRLWETEFLREGFILTKLLRPIHSGYLSSLLVFRRREQ